MLRTTLALAFLALFALAIGIPLLLLGWVAGTAGPFYSAAKLALRWSLALGGVRRRIEGSENIPPGPCLFMPNHTSAVDPIAVFVSIPRQVAFMAKQELFRIPLFGWAMRLESFIPVDRASHEAAASSADLAVEHLRSGGSMVIYPEGTRSPDGRLLPFKRGAFLLAIRAKRPIVPITILGAERVLARGQSWLRPGEIRLIFHPAVDAAAYAESGREELLKQVRAVIGSRFP